MKKTNIITPMWLNAINTLKSGDLKNGDDLMMKLIFKLAQYTQNGFKDDDKVEGTKMYVWKSRCWVSLENYNLIPL